MSIDEEIRTADEQSKKFSDILDRIEDVPSQQKTLWLEIYANAVEDRARARSMFDVLVETCKSASGELAVHGATIAKFLERMSRANDQLGKLSELISLVKEKNDKIDIDDAYNAIEKKK
jgi:hypothetical protein